MSECSVQLPQCPTEPELPTGETLNEDASLRPTAFSEVPHLFLLFECAQPLCGPARHALLNIDEVLIGRGATRSAIRAVRGGVRQLVLRVADPRISARHAVLRRRGLGWEFEDLASTNGSRLAGEPIGSAMLADAALLQLGHTLFLFRANVRVDSASLGDGGVADLDAGDLRQPHAAFATMLPELSDAFDTLSRVAASRVPILLLGETGCGKEWIARAVHAQSGRCGEFVAVNCGAIPATLLESQFFGHMKGAFSGATRDEPGLVRAAHGGTLFLDEIGDLPLASQAVLLRVLQESEVTPVGATRPIPVDLRVIAATHAPIDQQVERGLFRSDLFARLAGFRFVAPALRSRTEDLGLLIGRILGELAPPTALPTGVAPDAARALFRYPWPRNIRELKHCLEAAAVLSDGGLIELSQLQHTLHAPPAALSCDGTPAVRRSDCSPADHDTRLRQDLEAHFAACHGNISEVARRTGKARVQIQRWMKRFTIDPAKYQR